MGNIYSVKTPYFNYDFYDILFYLNRISFFICFVFILNYLNLSYCKTISEQRQNMSHYNQKVFYFFEACKIYHMHRDIKKLRKIQHKASKIELYIKPRMINPQFCTITLNMYKSGSQYFLSINSRIDKPLKQVINISKTGLEITATSWLSVGRYFRISRRHFT